MRRGKPKPPRSTAGGPFRPSKRRGFGERGDPETPPRLPAGRRFIRTPHRRISPTPGLVEEVPREARDQSARGAAWARAGLVGDILLTRNISLTTDNDNSVFTYADDGSEQSVATNGKGIVLYTTNTQDAISFNGGRTFSKLNPRTAFPTAAGGFCCDQMVTYVPSVDRFVWVLQYWNGAGGTTDRSKPNVLRVATATSGQLAASGGTRWSYYDWTPNAFRLSAPEGKAILLDRPFMAFSKGMLHFSVSAFELTGDKQDALGSVLWRLPLDQLGGRFRWGFLRAKGRQRFVPAQGAVSEVSPGPYQYYAGAATSTRLDVYEYRDSSSKIYRYEVDVPPIARLENGSPAPGDPNWLARHGKSSGSVVTGAQVGRLAWFGWPAGREATTLVDGKEKPLKVHDQPAIEFVGIDIRTLTQEDYSRIEFNDYASALPELRANATGELAVSFAYGGPTASPSHAVGFLPMSLTNVTRRYAMATTVQGEVPDTSIGGGLSGDYFGLATDPSQPNCFIAAGSAAKALHYYDAHYIVFGRAGFGCTVPSPPAPPPPPPAAKPDLVVDSLTDPRNGTLNVTVRNAGGASASASKLGVTFSVGGGETLLDTPALDGGESTIVSAPCPSASPSATARADATNLISESDETNNTRTEEVLCTFP
jgi:hypothetical protein